MEGLFVFHMHVSLSLSLPLSLSLLLSVYMSLSSLLSPLSSLPSPLSSPPSHFSSLPSPLSPLLSPLSSLLSPLSPLLSSGLLSRVFRLGAREVGLTPTSPHPRPGTIAVALHHGVIPRGEGHEEVAAGNTRSGKAHACTPASAARVRVLQPALERTRVLSWSVFSRIPLCSAVLVPPSSSRGAPTALHDTRLHAPHVSTPLVVAYSAA